MSGEKVKTGRKQVQHYADYQRTFNSEHGRRVLLHLMKEFHIFGNLPKGDLEFADGQRSVILTIIKKLRMDTKEMLTALEEYERNEEA